MPKIEVGDVVRFIPSRAPMIRGTMTGWLEYGSLGWFERTMGHLRCERAHTVKGTGTDIRGRATVWLDDVQVYADDCELLRTPVPSYPSTRACDLPYG